MMELTRDNYFSPEATQEYMSESQYKSLVGVLGRKNCEAKTMAEIRGEWHEEPSNALLIGSYVDAYFEGSLDNFKWEHPEIFRKDGELKAQFVQADKMIERALKDVRFRRSMQGEKQKIMTGEIGGVPWKIKMDSYHPGVAIVDLKTTEDVNKLFWVRDVGYVEWQYYWGYDIQGAVYQEIVYQNTGKQLPFYIMAVDKHKEPGLGYYQIPQFRLDEALSRIPFMLPAALALKNGEVEPVRCEDCDYCRATRVLDKPIFPEDMPKQIA